MASAPTALQLRLAGRILSHARSLGWTRGHHLTEESLLPVLGASRTPIRAALAHLALAGVVEQRPNRGFFLKDSDAVSEQPTVCETAEDESEIYRIIASDRLSHALPAVVSENALIRRYSLSRARLRHVLARIAAEGWIERRPGRGWAFLPLIDTPAAYRENYRFREIIEPAALRAPEFQLDPVRLSALHDQQSFVLNQGRHHLSQVELFEINSAFHEGLAAMSGNRFFVQTLSRLNQLRRLMEYDRPVDRERTGRICREHLAILEALTAGDRARAADTLEAHLRDAVQEKAPAADGAEPS